MKCVSALGVLACALGPLVVSAQQKTAVPHTAPSTAGSKTTHTTASTHAKTHVTARTRSRSTKSRARRAAAPSYQLHPDPDRYQQIQQALTDRGYFKGQVNGQWSDDSSEALKRFQADQKLDGDGKINSLTLIGLGLGPKHDGTTSANLNHLPVPDPAAPEEPPSAPPPAPAELPADSTQSPQ